MGRPAGIGLLIGESVPGQRGPRGTLDFEELMRISEAGACRGEDPERWFPGRKATVAAVHALMQQCGRCEVEEACLRYALVHRMDWGVWGGTSERSRRRLRSQVLRLAKAEGLTWEQAVDKVVE